MHDAVLLLMLRHDPRLSSRLDALVRGTDDVESRLAAGGGRGRGVSRRGALGAQLAAWRRLSGPAGLPERTAAAALSGLNTASPLLLMLHRPRFRRTPWLL